MNLSAAHSVFALARQYGEPFIPEPARTALDGAIALLDDALPAAEQFAEQLQADGVEAVLRDIAEVLGVALPPHVEAVLVPAAAASAPDAGAAS